MLVHHSSLPYEVALKEAAESTRKVFKELIERGKRNAPILLDEIVKNAPTDYLVDTRLMDFECDDNQQITVAFGHGRLPLHRNAIQHLAARSEIFTTSVIDKMRKAGPWATEMLTECLRKIYRNIDRERVLVRVSRGEVKAILSDSYLRIDSVELVASLIQIIHTHGLVVINASVGELQWNIDVALPNVFEPVKNDPIMWGFQIGNSDYGKGSFSIKSFIERLWCTNKAIRKDVYNRVHLGARLPEDIRMAEDTMKKQSAYFTSVFRDFLRSFVNADNVGKEMEGIHRAHTQGVFDPEAAIKEYAKQAQVSATDAKEALAAYQSFETVLLPPAPKEGSLWRLSNAFSLIANQRTDYEQVQALQQAAGLVLHV